MTIAGWIIYVTLAGCAVIMYIAVAYDSNGKTTWIAGGVITGLVCLILLVSMLWYFSATASGQRAIKSQRSNLEGGISRTVTLYDYNGKEIQHWSGVFDVTENDNETYFDLDGKRVIIQGGIVVNEEW